MRLKDWTTAIPVYVTRETADGIIGNFTLAAWLSVPAVLLVVVNVILWGVVGIIAAVQWLGG